MKKGLCSSVLTILLGCSAHLCAQAVGDPGESPVSKSRGESNGASSARAIPIRIYTDLTLIPVLVTDSADRAVTGLGREHFRVFEDGVEQRIVSFGAEDSPVSVGLVFDSSGSMGTKLNMSREGIAEFLKTTNSKDDFFLLQFDTRPQPAGEFTSAPQDILDQLSRVESRGRTALLDAVSLGLQKLRKARNPRRALLVISDGGDNNSRYTQSEIKKMVQEADVQIYVMRIHEQTNRWSKDQMIGPALLTELCKETGGRSFAIEDLRDLPGVATKIGLELRNQYLLGYRSTQDANGGYRRVTVKLRQTDTSPHLRAYWRRGYTAPVQWGVPPDPR
jgi:Ca-activated chloride channel family protein